MNVIDIVVGGGFGGVGLVGRSTGWKTHKKEKFPIKARTPVKSCLGVISLIFQGCFLLDDSAVQC